MIQNKILVPVDFSETSNTAIQLASGLAKKENLSITLLHIQNGKSIENAESELKSLANSIKSNNLQVETIIKKGNLFSEIAEVANDQSYSMMVIGSHGYKGLREKFFGADILKLLKNIPIPVIAVQNDYVLPEQGIKSILFPASSHESFTHKIEAAVSMAKLFNAEIHIYTVEKPGHEWSEQFRENIRMAKQTFEEHNVKYVRVTEEQKSYSVGYSKQIMAYATSNKIDLISMMTNPTKENYYLADNDKENILTNDAGIPVLCTCDKRVD